MASGLTIAVEKIVADETGAGGVTAGETPSDPTGDDGA
jgi:hypothetical protein